MKTVPPPATAHKDLDTFNRGSEDNGSDSWGAWLCSRWHDTHFLRKQIIRGLFSPRMRISLVELQRPRPKAN